MKEFWDKTWSRKYERYNRHHQEIWSAVLPFLKGKVLDLGCGPAYIYRGLDIDLTGVDYSAEALREAKLNYPAGLYILAEAISTKLPDQSFDTVVMLGLLDWVPDWQAMMTEAKRLVKPEGQIIATVLNGYKGHDWTRQAHVVGNWYIIK